jgi:hypothetical protein
MDPGSLGLSDAPDLYSQEIVAVRTIGDHLVSPPWVAPVKLHDIEGRKEGVIEVAAHASRVITTDVERITYLVAGIARAFEANDFCFEPGSKTRIFSHVFSVLWFLWFV